MALIGLLLIPLLVGGSAFVIWKKTITKKEFLLIESIAVVIAIGGFFIARWQSMRSVEHWNGRISAKIHDSQSCCHCREVCSTCTDSDGNSYSCNCHEVCDHSRDYYWALDISTGDRVSIKRCESNRHAVPSAWTKAYIGEPASVEHSYTNYLKADPDSLLNRGAPQQYMPLVPRFPGIYDYYKSNKVIPIGVTVPQGWEQGLRDLNADLGPSKQIDVTMVFTKNDDPKFAEAVEHKWLYGPKNAAIIVTGINAENRIAWARVVTISRVEDFKIFLRDELVNTDITQPSDGLKIIRQAVIEKFKRTSMKEFEYLASAARPSDGVLALLYILTLIVSAGLIFWAHKNDIFSEHGFRDNLSNIQFRRFR